MPRFGREKAWPRRLPRILPFWYTRDRMGRASGYLLWVAFLACLPLLWAGLVRAQSMLSPVDRSGYTAYCRRTGDCAVGRVTLTPQIMALLREVNARINRECRYVEEPAGEDEWRDCREVGYGDCEDFALAKRAELVRRGIPRAALPLALMVAETGQPHAVLLVETDRGPIALDHRYPEPIEPHRLPYRNWIREGGNGLFFALQ